MEFYQLSGSDVRLSRVALGGHEYLPNGNSRGFNEDFARAITPGHHFPGFGGDGRKAGAVTRPSRRTCSSCCCGTAARW